jgi:putative FmdB family regulatory protein
MPFYEYECQACKYYIEVMQKITDAPLTQCPSCGKRQLKKLVSAPVFRLKGAGWYETDFKSDKEGQRNLVGADKEEAKSEAKAPEAKEGKEGKEGKPEVKEAKESKESKDAKDSKEPKARERKSGSSTSGAAAGRGRRGTSVSGKAAHKKPKAAARKAGRKRRR